MTRRKSDRVEITWKTIVIFFSVLLLAVAITAMVYVNYVVIGIHSVDVEVEIEDSVAFKLDPDKMYFGSMMAGGYAKRGIDLSPGIDSRMKVSVKPKGEIARWLTTDKDGFWMESNETVTVTLHPPDGTPLGTYTGQILFVFKRI
ncbi:MAG: hypothetical protein ABIC95_00410 [archaeon]